MGFGDFAEVGELRTAAPVDAALSPLFAGEGLFGAVHFVVAEFVEHRRELVGVDGLSEERRERGSEHC